MFKPCITLDTLINIKPNTQKESPWKLINSNNTNVVNQLSVSSVLVLDGLCLTMSLSILHKCNNQSYYTFNYPTM